VTILVGFKRQRFRRYPEQKALNLPMPAASDIALFRVEPTVISVLDYTKGFATPTSLPANPQT